MRRSTAPAAPAVPEPPALILGLTDGVRALSELSWFYGSRRWLTRYGRHGSGRGVLVLPGLSAGDWSTRPLRTFLTKVGYEAYGWGLGTNIGPTAEIMSGLDPLLASVVEASGGPVSIIGQSLGGIFGAELARRHPDSVDRLITLGSPMSISDARQSRADSVYRKHSDRHLEEYAFETWRLAPRPEIPSTSIFSRLDGILHPEACRYPASPLTENIEVYGSHLGMAVHPAAVYATLDRLAAPVGEAWRPFRAPAALRLYFPRQ